MLTIKEVSDKIAELQIKLANEQDEDKRLKLQGEIESLQDLSLFLKDHK